MRFILLYLESFNLEKAIRLSHKFTAIMNRSFAGKQIYEPENKTDFCRFCRSRLSRRQRFPRRKRQAARRAISIDIYCLMISARCFDN